jgi:hypothetical protein
MICKGTNCTYNHPLHLHSPECTQEHEAATMTGEEQLLHWIAMYKDKRDKETCPAMIVTLNNMIK